MGESNERRVWVAFENLKMTNSMNTYFLVPLTTTRLQKEDRTNKLFTTALQKGQI